MTESTLEWKVQRMSSASDKRMCGASDSINHLIKKSAILAAAVFASSVYLVSCGDDSSSGSSKSCKSDDDCEYGLSCVEQCGGREGANCHLQCGYDQTSGPRCYTLNCSK